MPAFYVETSAFMKRYRHEPGSDVVDELHDRRLPHDRLITSHLTALEVHAAVTGLYKGRIYTRRQYERLMRRVLHELERYDVMPLDDSLVDDAHGLLPTYALRAPDGLHVASALRASRTGDRFFLVTGDRDIRDAARGHGLDVIDPEAPEVLDYLRELR